MPIQMVAQRRRLPILGKIRLGVRKENAKGSLYPAEVEYFVLTDAPGVEEVYGKDPKELDAFFPGDDLEIVLPTWFKSYGAGRKDQTGRIIGGKLNCMGNGPRTDVIDELPVTSPGTAQHFAARDPVTRVVPIRPCMGQECPDYIAKKCRQTMKAIVILPRVSIYGAYEIDTSSWHSIKNFDSQIHHIMSTRGSIKFFPFKIYRSETVTTHPENGVDVTKIHHIMKIRPNENLYELHGEEIRRKIEQFQTASFLLPASAEEINKRPFEDHFPVLPEGSSDDVVDVDTGSPQKQGAQDILNDPEVQQAFAAYEQISGKKFSTEVRLKAIDKKKGEADPKAAVLSEINRIVTDLTAKANEKQEKIKPAVKAAGDSIL